MSSHRALRAEKVRRALRAVTIAWMFGATWQWVVTGAALTQFAKKGLGMPEWAFGLLAMTPYLGGLAQLPAGLFLARFGHRRTVFLVTLVVGRITWAAIAGIPWLLPGEWRWPALIGMALFAYGLSSASTPSWMNWMADVIPWKVRGRYFALRNQIGLYLGVAVTIGVGVFMDRYGEGMVLKVTGVLLAAAGVLGAIDPLFFLQIEDEAAPPNRPRMSLLEFFAEPLGDRGFRWYLAYNFTITVACVAFGQYVWLYALYVVGVSNTMANVLIQAVTMVGMAATYGAWGRLTDRVGRRPVLILCTALSALYPLGWMFIGSGPVRVGWGVSVPALWLGFAITLPTVLSWAGVEVANFNLLLNISGSREERHGGACVALQALAACAGAVVSCLAGAAIAEWGKGWRYPVEALGVVLTYHSLIFALTMAARVAAAWMAMKVREPRSHGTRQVIRHVTSIFYANVRQMMALPGVLGLWD